MTTKKITKKDRYTEMVAMFTEMGRADLADFCTHEMELLAKKNAGKSKVSEAEQAKRNAIAEAVETILANADEPMANAEICKAMPSELGTINTQKLTPILAKLVEAEVVAVSVVKGRKLFTLA